MAFKFRQHTNSADKYLLYIIANADIILTVKDGNVVEQGSHSELLKRAFLRIALQCAVFLIYEY